MSAGETVTLNDGSTRKILSVISAPNWGDVSVATVDADLPTWSTVTAYTNFAPTDAMFVGAGLTGDGEVRDADDQLRGWYWGGTAGKLKWTQSNTTYATQTTEDYETGFDAKPGSFAMTAGDSGGGFYVKDANGGWHLQGIGVGIYAHNGLLNVDGKDASEFTPAQLPTNLTYQTNQMLMPREWLRSLVPLAGDTDFNGSVDFADLVALAHHYDDGGTWSGGDFNGDGDVNFKDLIALAKNYNGNGIDIASMLALLSRTDVGPVMIAPEPGVLIGLALPIVLSRRRRVV